MDAKPLSGEAGGKIPDFGSLYDSYFPRVYNYVSYRVQNPETADDVVSRIFEQVLQKMETFNPQRAPFEVWLFSVARNAVSDHFRTKKRRVFFSLDILPERAADGEAVDDCLAGRETCRELLAAVGHLDERERDIIGLRFGSRMTNRAIAEVTGLSESNVAVILYRALQKLKNLLAGA